MRTNNPVVFHFTSSLALPWILASGELRPTRGTLPGIGHVRYLWGTANPDGDYTALPLRAIHHGREDEWQAGVFQLVRFTLPANAFMTWNEIVRVESNWTPEEVAELVEFDRREFDEHGQDLWRCRWDPLRLSDVIKVEVTSYADHEDETWWPLDISRPEKLLIRSRKPDRVGVRIGAKRFHSERAPSASFPDCFYHSPWPEPEVTRAKRLEAALEAWRDAARARRKQLEEDYEPPEH